ncbi:hypothetical protein [Vibrio sp. D431a]|uniref:hypothetical protein n=1 Tax=Vibrio sp. D431a TaxID=2837388 RepID=UPI002552476C|nr:hypothetical protein [Vibrio sp. D431a]MDK9793699.1 hypothetical protein [Vibrio sp. D431a]
MSAILNTVNFKEYITIPFTLSSSKLSDEAQNVFTTDFVYPVAVNEDFVILSADTAIEFPTKANLNKLLGTIYANDKGGYSFNINGEYYVDINLIDDRIICELRDSKQLKIKTIDSDFIYLNEIVKLGSYDKLEQGKSLSIKTLASEFLESSKYYDPQYEFNTILSVASVDFDIVMDASSMMMLVGGNERIFGHDKIIERLNREGLSVLDALDYSLNETVNNEAVKDFNFDPAPEFNLVVHNNDMGEVFEPLDSSNLNINLDELLQSAFKVISTELYTR